MTELDYGEAVNSLPAREKRFVLAFMDEPPSLDAPMNAAIAAGYENPRREAAALLKDRGILAALRELGCAAVLAQIPAAIAAINDTIDEPYNKNRLKAAEMILNRFDPIVQRLEVKTESINREEITLDHLRHLIEIGVERAVLVREFGEFGLQRYQKMLDAQAAKAPMIEGEKGVDWNDLL